MRRFAIAALLIGTALAVVPAGSGALPAATTVETYKGGLAFPVDMAWVTGTKRIFFTEKDTGKVRVMIGRRLLDRPCVNLDVYAAGESGALGIVLHPRFKENHFLYVFYNNDSPREGRVTRFTVSNNRCRDARHVVRGLDVSSGYHNGGQLEFVDGKLFVSTGEAHRESEAQRKDNRLGKILRLNPDGSIPDGNPFSQPGDRNPVWSYGHRNPFGLAHKPGSKWLFESENGPNCDDELNRIKKGRNYGWGDNYQCGTAGVGPNPKGPMKRWTPTIVPTDLWWYQGRLRSLNGDLYMGDFQGRLHRFSLNDRGTSIRRHRVIYRGEPIVDVAEGPRGWLYFLTPDSIVRIVRR